MSALPFIVTGTKSDMVQMDGARVRAIREGIGLSQAGLAHLLRLGLHGKRTVARWEAGDTPVTGPVSVALEAVEAGWSPGSAAPICRAEGLAVLEAAEKAVLQALEQVRNEWAPTNMG